jgi:regulator of RNase E activity RraA
MALGYRVFTEVARPPSELVKALADISPADLVDCMQKAGMVDARIQPIYRPMPRFAGPAVTVSLPTGAFNPKKMALEMTMAGDVVVIAARGIEQYAVLGGNIAYGLKRRGLAGVIVDGAVRDAQQMQADGFPVHARRIALNSSPKAGPGEVNVPVAFGQCVIFPGDIVVADEDGIAVVPPAHAQGILSRYERLRQTHASFKPALEHGEVTNIDAIRHELENSGCEFIASVWTR